MEALATTLYRFVPSGPDFARSLACFAALGFEKVWHVFASGVVLSDVNDMATVTASDALDPAIQGTLTLSVL